MITRASGILLHISSLAGKYGIGDFGKCAYDFVDFLEKSGQKYWQILPIGTTGYGDSPYQSFSAFAGNPYFIDLDQFITLNFLEKSDLQNLEKLNEIHEIQYDKLYIERFQVLKKAFENFKNNPSKNISLENEIKIFKNKNIWWLENYSLFMGIKKFFNEKSWIEWSRDYKFKNKKVLKFFKNKFKDEIEFHNFLQYFFFNQWKNLKTYANNKNIKIIGDIPIFISTDSVDTWQNPSMFFFDKKLKPTKVAGCPPDYFTSDGQLWGNVLYRWKEMEKDNFSWWKKRIKHSFNLYDTVKIDHFRGFDSYWSIPAKDKTAKFGKWEKGPGIKFFNSIKKSLGSLDIIAEDLGFLTEKVKKLLKDSQYPGMKILEFAFDGDMENIYLPHNYKVKSVAYTGTHDNQTVVGWYNSINQHNKEFCNYYIDNYLCLTSLGEDYIIKSINWLFIETLWKSNSYLAIAPLQDFLGLDDASRMNIPSTTSANWIWRISNGDLTEDLAFKISALTKKYNR